MDKAVPGFDKRKIWLKLAAWGYLFLVFAMWTILYIGGDRWWPATLLLFGPRWLAVIPLLLLLPWIAWRNRRLFMPVILAAIIVLGPFMGLAISFKAFKGMNGPAIRIVTCNIGNGDFNPSLLEAFIRKSGADIVALQECPRAIPISVPSDWSVLKDGQLAVLSRYPLRLTNTLQAKHPGHKWPRNSFLQCTVMARGGDFSFNVVHLPSPRYGLQNIIDRHTFINLSRTGLLAEETALRRQTASVIREAVASSELPVIVAGDFNTPPDGTIYRQMWGGYGNAFSKAGSGYGWTVWNTVAGLPIGVRVDHVLFDGGFVAVDCQTGPDVGSDHLPLLAEMRRIRF